MRYILCVCTHDVGRSQMAESVLTPVSRARQDETVKSLL